MAASLAQAAADLTLWYDKPATDWQSEALPIGNGRLGAMIFGDPQQRKMFLLWSVASSALQFGYFGVNNWMPTYLEKELHISFASMAGYMVANYTAMIGGKKAKERAAHLLDQVGLGARMQHLPSELSGGEQQRVAIARSLVNDPQILFADEPTGNLDSKTGGEIMNLLLNVVAEARKTLMVVTHDTRLAGHGDRMLVLSDGMLEK